MIDFSISPELEATRQRTIAFMVEFVYPNESKMVEDEGFPADLEIDLQQRVKALGLSGEGKIRINQAGCLDRCEEGPCIVVYPEAVWYTYVDRADVDEIIEEHLKHGRVVERLKM